MNSENSYQHAHWSRLIRVSAVPINNLETKKWKVKIDQSYTYLWRRQFFVHSFVWHNVTFLVMPLKYLFCTSIQPTTNARTTSIFNEILSFPVWVAKGGLTACMNQHMNVVIQWPKVTNMGKNQAREKSDVDIITRLKIHSLKSVITGLKNINLSKLLKGKSIVLWPWPLDPDSDYTAIPNALEISFWI